MNVLVIGQGGREHALVKALRSSPSVRKIHAIPGSEGMALEAQCHKVHWGDFDKLHELIRREEVDLVVVGPEVPLAGGVADALRDRDVLVFGPSTDGARLESSKIFSKEFMVEAGVRTARFRVVDSVESTREAMREFSPPYVLKADGLAAGKGVFICKTDEELLEAAKTIFVDRVLSAAGARALVEEFQPGYEISYLILTNGREYEPLLLAQDHKRLCDGDEGPNTGGMGVVAPVEIDDRLRARINDEIVVPILETIEDRDFLYRGILYIGLMITADGPSVLEFNVRFGDPEAQAILPLLDGDWGIVFRDVAAGYMPKLKWKNLSTACVVLAAEGYPDLPVLGAPIEGLETIRDRENPERAYLLHAGTRRDPQSGWVTHGGRVLNAIGIGQDMNQALANAYEIARQVSWPGMQYRRDIGKKAPQTKS
jgi:phosphoribosylamine--glycine ligase